VEAKPADVPTLRQLGATGMQETLRALSDELGCEALLSLLDKAAAGDEALEARLARVKIRIHEAVNTPGRPIAEPGWQDRFESALHRRDIAELDSCTREFAYKVERFGEIIIAEVNYPVHLKTIRPISIGGLAGGNKFVVDGILFKFAQDFSLAGVQPQLFMYGGPCEDHNAAGKAAGHERKSLQQVRSSLPSFPSSSLCLHKVLKRAVDTGIFGPLMTVLDFRGLRLSAQSLLPIDPGSLIYGSCRSLARSFLSPTPFHAVSALSLLPHSAGQRISDASGLSSTVVRSIQDLARSMGIGEHRVFETDTQSEKKLCFPVDIEIHASKKDPSRLYVVDSARVFPPVAPSEANPRSIFFQLFRPEFLAFYVASGGALLSSDAFSRFGLLDWREHNARVTEATRMLLDVRIPQVAQVLAAELLSVDQDEEVRISRRIQQFGVNVRYLGLVRAALPATALHVRLLVLREMIARVASNQLRASWRMLNTVSVGPYVAAACDMINALITGEPPWLRAALIDKFGDCALSVEERAMSGSLVALVSSHKVIEILAESAGIVVSRAAIAAGQITESDVELKARVKPLQFLSVVQAEGLRREAKRRADDRRVELLNRSRGLLLSELIGDPRDKALLARFVRVKLNYLEALKIPTEDMLQAAWQRCADLPEATHERAYFTARLCVLRCNLALVARSVPDAVQYARVAAEKLDELQLARYSLLEGETNFGKKTAKLREQVWSLITAVVSCVSTMDDLHLVSALEPHFAQSGLLRAMMEMDVRDRMASQLLLCVLFVLRDENVAASIVRAVIARAPTRLEIARFFTAPLSLLFVQRLSLLLQLQLSGEDASRDTSHVAELVLSNSASAPTSALQTLINCFPRASALHFVRCHSLNLSELVVSPRVTVLHIQDCATVSASVFWQWIESAACSLQSLVLRHLPSLEPPSSRIILPTSLRHLEVTSCPLIVRSRLLIDAIAGCTSLSSLHWSEALPLPALPRRLEVLQVDALHGGDCAQPSFPRLRVLKLRVTDDPTLLQLVRAAPRLHTLELDLYGTQVTILEAVALLPGLQRLSLRSRQPAAFLSLQDLAAALAQSGVQLDVLEVPKMVLVWSSSSLSGLLDRLPPVVFRSSLACMALPEAVLLGLPNTLRSLTLEEAQVSDAAWQHLTLQVAPSLEVLSLVGIQSCSNAVLDALLCASVQLRTLRLRNIPATELRQSESLARLTQLELVSCCRSPERFLAALTGLPALQNLTLENGPESSSMFVVLAQHCFSLSFLAISSPPTAGLRDEFHWLGQLLCLETLHLEHCAPLARDVAVSLPRLGRLWSLRLDTMFEMPSLSLKNCAALVEFVAHRTLLTEQQMVDVCGTLPGLARFEAFLLDCSPEKVARVLVVCTRNPRLRQVSIMDPALMSDMVPTLVAPTVFAPTNTLLRERSASSMVSIQAPVAKPLTSSARTVEDLYSQLSARPRGRSTAFTVFSHDEFSLLTFFALASRGYRIVCAVTVGVEIQQRLSDSVLARMRELFPEDRVLWVDVDIKEPHTLKELQVRATEFAGAAGIEVAVLLWPFERNAERGWIESSRPSFAQLDSWPTWEWRMSTMFFGPVLLASIIYPLLRAAAAPRVAFHGYGLASISENTSGGRACRCRIALLLILEILQPCSTRALGSVVHCCVGVCVCVLFVLCVS
jgi:hypothetical protein